jgi:hypothetical protein
MLNAEVHPVKSANFALSLAINLGYVAELKQCLAATCVLDLC